MKVNSMNVNCMPTRLKHYIEFNSKVQMRNKSMNLKSYAYVQALSTVYQLNSLKVALHYMHVR